MPYETFDGRSIEVIDFFDTSIDERVIEFRDPGLWDRGSFLAIALREGKEWHDAVVSIDPQVGDVPVRLMVWAIEIAKFKVS
ncbi:hypothetical protein ACIBCT_40060 [Streptosporangium sp. NPDC050855]|uniref:hypothetical protein n=1 Tax=Streptosporangium sp. NPDC050855 TaxID=3366194 RepID=UPI00378E6162